MAKLSFPKVITSISFEFFGLSSIYKESIECIFIRFGLIDVSILMSYN